jgi:hypothetical protein
MVLNARRAQNVPKNHEVILGFCSHAIHACHHQEAHIATTYQLHADDIHNLIKPLNRGPSSLTTTTKPEKCGISETDTTNFKSDLRPPSPFMIITTKLHQSSLSDPKPDSSPLAHAFRSSSFAHSATLHQSPQTPLL